MALPVSVIDAIRDVCHLVEDNPTVQGGRLKARAIALGGKIDDSIAARTDLQFAAEDFQAAMDLTEAVALAAVNGVQLDARKVILRLCEDIVAPIAALAFRDLGADHVG